MIEVDRDACSSVYLAGVAVMLCVSLLAVIGTTVIAGRPREGRELALPLFFVSALWPVIAAFVIILSPVAIMQIAAWATAKIVQKKGKR